MHLCSPLLCHQNICVHSNENDPLMKIRKKMRSCCDEFILGNGFCVGILRALGASNDNLHDNDRILFRKVPVPESDLRTLNENKVRVRIQILGGGNTSRAHLLTVLPSENWNWNNLTLPLFLFLTRFGSSFSRTRSSSLFFTIAEQSIANFLFFGTENTIKGHVPMDSMGLGDKIHFCEYIVRTAGGQHR